VLVVGAVVGQGPVEVVAELHRVLLVLGNLL
jgi:hypothetical protein